MDKTRCILTQLSQGAQPRVTGLRIPRLDPSPTGYRVMPAHASGTHAHHDAPAASSRRAPSPRWNRWLPLANGKSHQAATTIGCARRARETCGADADYGARHRPSRAASPRRGRGRNAYLTHPVPRVNPRLGRAHADQLHPAPVRLRKVESVERFSWIGTSGGASRSFSLHKNQT